MNLFSKIFSGLKKRKHQATVGDNSYIDSTAQFIGSKRIKIGTRCVIGENAWLNVNDWGASGYAIEIGDFSFIARRNFLTAGSHIRIGAYCLTGPDCHFLGADHAFDDPMIPYAIAPVRTTASIEIGANCWFGARVTVLKGVTIGYGSVIGANALVTNDIPPFSIVVGSPAKVVKRYSFDQKRWIAAAEWNCADENTFPSEEDYLASLRKTHPYLKLPTPAASHQFGHL
ncbi:MAG: acyltransferase [Chthoniobacterales bacterium]